MEEAYDTALEAVQLCESDDDTRVRCLLNLALITLHKALYDKVKRNLDEALLICEHQTCYVGHKKKALKTYAEMHIQLDQYDMAQEKASGLLETACSTGDKEMQFEGHFLLGWIASHEGNLVEAERCYHELVKLSTDIKKPEYERKVRKFFLSMENTKQGTTGNDVSN